MERYDSYKDSGVQWLGEIPSHWELRKSKYLWQETENRSESGRETLLSVSQYDGVRESTETSRSESLAGYKIVHENNLVINIMLAWLGGLGVSNFEGIVSPAYCVYNLIDKQNPQFLHYLYRTPLYLAEFARHSTGIVPSRWRMYTDDFGQVLTLLPPIDEQNAMVSYLDEATSKIDEAIAQQQKMIDLLNERKQIIIQEAVTKGLNPNAKMKDSGIEWIGEIPEHWDVMKLKFVASVTDGTHFSPETTSEGKKYVTVSNVNNDRINLESANCISKSDFELLVKQGCQPEVGDILLAKDGTVGRTAIVIENDFVALSSLGILHPKGLCTSEYIKWLLDSNGLQEQMKQLMAGSALRRITINKIQNLIFVVPPIEEQRLITSAIVNKTQPIDTELANKKKTIEFLQERKQIIINEVVTGKVKVSL